MEHLQIVSITSLVMIMQIIMPLCVCLIINVSCVYNLYFTDNQHICFVMIFAFLRAKIHAKTCFMHSIIPGIPLSLHTGLSICHPYGVFNHFFVCRIYSSWMFHELLRLNPVLTDRATYFAALQQNTNYFFTKFIVVPLILKLLPIAF